MDPAVFFPEPGQNVVVAQAKRVCAGCDVRAACLDAHLEERVGIFGGMTAKDREVERRRRTAAGVRAVRRQPPVHGTEAGYARHRRAGEVPCDACREGHAEAKRLRRTAAS
jgi:hypothetical protein